MHLDPEHREFYKTLPHEDLSLAKRAQHNGSEIRAQFSYQISYLRMIMIARWADYPCTN